MGGVLFYLPFSSGVGDNCQLKMVRVTIGMKLAGRGDSKRHFLILNASKTLSHVHFWVTVHPGFPDTVPFMPAFLAYLLIDLPSLLKNIFIGMINYMVILHIYQNAKGISHLIVFNNFENLWRTEVVL